MAIWEDEATYLMSSYFVSAALHDIESGRVPDYTRKSDIEHPSLMKKLGRKVRNFDDVIWKEKRFGVVVKGKY